MKLYVPPSTESPANPEIDFYEGHDLEALVDMPRYYNWILDSFGPYLRGHVLEVGAGTGNFSSYYLPGVEQATLLEPAKNLFPRLEARFSSDSKVQVVNGLLEEWIEGKQEILEETFEAAVMVNVLEHIEDDYGTIQRIGRLLQPGGHLLLFIPAKGWLYGSLDTVFGHYRRYTQSRLRRVVERAGLNLVNLRYFDFFGMLPWFLTGRVLKQTTISAGAAKLYDRYCVPVAQSVERWLKPPVGKNLLCIATRPAKVSIPFSAPMLQPSTATQQRHAA